MLPPTLINSRPFVYFAIFAALVAFVYMWRSEIYRAAESACLATVSQKTVEASNVSVKAASEVRKNEQSKTKDDVVRELCYIGIMRENRGCK